MRRLGLLLLAAAISVSVAAVTAYSVAPRTAAWSGWTRTLPGQDTVSQTLTCNFDSLVYADFFVGDTGIGGLYKLDVYEYPDGVNAVASNAGAHALQPHSWLNMPLTVQSGYQFTKGKLLEFRFTRSGSDSINYYYDATSGGPYQYGQMIVPGEQPPPSPDADLCMRVYGRMNVIDSTFWGALVDCYDWDAGHRDSIAKYVAASGIRLDRLELPWEFIQPESAIQWRFEWTDSAVEFSRGRLGCEIIGVLDYATRWTGTHVDSYPPSYGGTAYWYDTAIGSPPRNLWPSMGQPNYWARYVDTVVKRYGDSIHTWEVWNESNHIDRFWQRPNMPGTYADTSDRGMCSLYVRLCQVAESVIHFHDSTDRVLVGSVLTENGIPRVAGFDWLRLWYDITDEQFWDGVSVHPYRLNTNPFMPDSFEADAESVRQIMRADSDYSQVWVTEVGWSTEFHSEAVQANALAEVFTSAKASEARPTGGYDRMCWYCFPERLPEFYGLLDSLYKPKASCHAMAQLSGALTGRRLNGRVLLGDSRDDSCRIYEFEDPADDDRKLWVAWANDPVGPGAPSVAAALPARTADCDTIALDYGIGTQPHSNAAEHSGWLQTTLTAQPAFYTEPTGETISRPDIVVDSVKVSPLQPRVGKPCSLYAYVHNAGEGLLLDLKVAFYCNGLSVYEAEMELDSTDGTQVCGMEMDSVPAWMHGSALFSAQANPGQEFVELGMDDNAGYVKTRVLWPPDGSITVATDGGKNNLPLVGIKLQSESHRPDTTGVPAESARLFQQLLDKYDSVLASDSTGWMPFRTDNVWQFLHGEGRYRFFVQYKDDSLEVSNPIADTLHPTILFDSTSATGTLELNLGHRFTTTQQCSLVLAAADSLSGVAAMRLGNRPLANMVENGGFGSDAGWEFAGGGTYDNGLDMAVLPAKPDSVTSIWQLIPADSLASLLGDSFRLSADVLICPDSSSGDTLGRLSFEYCYYDDSASTTEWGDVAAAPVWDSLAALAGLGPLAVRFVLPDPAPQAGQTWLGGRVILNLTPHDGQSGTAWFDNVRLEPIGPAPDYSDWWPYDSLSTWDLGATPGEKVVSALLCDSSGNESQVAVSDTVILDPTPPVGAIIEPKQGSTVNGKIFITGFAYDSIEVAGDTWFESYRLYCQHVDSTEWSPAFPDSVSFTPVYGNPKKPKLLGKWDATELEDGNYYLYLVVSDSAGNETQYKTWVKVSNSTFPEKTGEGPTGGEVSLNSSGDVFVGSATGKIVRLDEELDSLSGFVFADSGQNAYVAGITELDSTHLLATDLRTGDVTRMTKQGTEKQELIQNLDLPVAVATDQSGNIWTLDKGESQLYKHRPDGTLALTIGSPGTDSTDLNDPEAFTICDSLVYIADTRNDRIAVYDTTGTLIELIAGEFQEPCAIAVTSDNRLYIVDKTSGTIEGLNSAGGHLLTIAATDSAPLRQLALTEDQLSLVTLKPGTNDILQYEVKSEDSLPGGIQTGGTSKLPPTFIFSQPHPNPMRTSLTISYAIPSRQRVAVTIYDIAGKKTATVTDQDHRPGYYNQVWNRTDRHGRTAANGVYFVEVRTAADRARKKVVLAR